MDTVERMKELADEQGLTLWDLAENCGIPWSLVKNVRDSGKQLPVAAIERCCKVLGMPLYQFFMTDDDWEDVRYYAVKRMGYRRYRVNERGERMIYMY